MTFDLGSGVPAIGYKFCERDLHLAWFLLSALCKWKLGVPVWVYWPVLLVGCTKIHTWRHRVKFSEKSIQSPFARKLVSFLVLTLHTLRKGVHNVSSGVHMLNKKLQVETGVSTVIHTHLFEEEKVAEKPKPDFAFETF